MTVKRGKTSVRRFQKTQKCDTQKKPKNSASIFRISDTIRMLKESKGETYDYLVMKAKEEFSIKENEKWILTRLRQMLLQENADFNMLQIGRSKNSVEDAEKLENEKGEAGDSSDKPNRTKKVSFNDIIDIKYF